MRASGVRVKKEAPKAKGGNGTRRSPEAAKPIFSSAGEQGHVEEMLDEAIEESLPASDPPSAVVPGSLASRQTQAKSKAGLRIAVITGSTRAERPFSRHRVTPGDNTIFPRIRGRGRL